MPTELHRPELVERWNTIADYFMKPMVAAAVGAWAWTFVWAAFGMPRRHWSAYVLFVLYGALAITWTAGFIALRRKNRYSIGNCPLCGGVINGRPPEDWVMECQHCNQEWVFAGTL